MTRRISRRRTSHRLRRNERFRGEALFDVGDRVSVGASEDTHYVYRAMYDYEQGSWVYKFGDAREDDYYLEADLRKRRVKRTHTDADVRYMLTTPKGWREGMRVAAKERGLADVSDDMMVQIHLKHWLRR